MERSSVSHLLALPPELRNRIYRYAIVQDEPIDVTYTTKKKEPALLTACKQIRDEALQMFYHENSFFCRLIFEGPLDTGENAASTSKLEEYFCWLATLGVATTSHIADFQVQIEIGMTAIVVPTQRGMTPEYLCDAIRRAINKNMETGFMMDWKAAFLHLGVKPRVVRFAVPDSIKTFDDAMNKVIGEEWKKRFEGWESEHVDDSHKSGNESAQADGEREPTS